MWPLILIVATPQPPPTLTLYLVVEDAAVSRDWSSDTLREAVQLTHSELVARAPNYSGIECYADEVLALREALKPMEVLTREEAGLPSDAVTPAYTFRRRVTPKPIRTDVFWTHAILLRHLLYLRRLHEVDLTRRNAANWESWYPRNYGEYTCCKKTMGMRFQCSWRRPVVEPFPAPPLSYFWSRSLITLDTWESEEYQGSAVLDILRAMDQGTGIVQPAIDQVLEDERIEREKAEWGAGHPNPPPLPEIP